MEGYASGATNVLCASVYHALWDRDRGSRKHEVLAHTNFVIFLGVPPYEANIDKLLGWGPNGRGKRGTIILSGRDAGAK